VSRRLISVVIPLHDHAEVVGEAIGSVLQQDYQPIEVIVVDDGSTDGGAEAAARSGPAVSVIRQRRGGAARARNRGAGAARGELLVFLDADDRMAPGRLARQAGALAENRGLDGVFGDVVEFRTGPAPGRDAPKPARLAGSLLLNRPAFEAVGPVAETLRTGEFIDWLARAHDAGLRLGYLPGVVLERRLHATNHGHDADRSAYAHVLHRVMARRRSSAG
jgi:glycosyltransferase involved in cell wall biosynthesis